MSATRNPFAYGKPITLDTLGDLFSHHRSITAGWSMEDAPPADPPPAHPPTYTPPASQADLDRIIGDRLAREREKFADYADIKKRAEAHDATLEAAKSDADKAIDAARTEGEKTATERVNARLVKSEARVLAVTAKFRDPADAVAFIDLSKVTVNDDGEVDAKAISEQLKTLAETKPYLVDDGKKPTPKPDRSQGGGGTETAASVSKGREMFENRRPKKTA